jgi:hypothetical protein
MVSIKEASPWIGPNLPECTALQHQYENLTPNTVLVSLPDLIWLCYVTLRDAQLIEFSIAFSDSSCHRRIQLSYAGVGAFIV